MTSVYRELLELQTMRAHRIKLVLLLCVKKCVCLSVCYNFEVNFRLPTPVFIQPLKKLNKFIPFHFIARIVVHKIRPLFRKISYHIKGRSTILTTSLNVVNNFKDNNRRRFCWLFYRFNMFISFVLFLHIYCLRLYKVHFKTGLG